MIQDLKYAWTAVRRNPWLWLASILTLTLGIGLNASVFTILQGLLFRARVDKDPASFVHLSPNYSGPQAGSEAPWTLSAHDYRTFAAESRTLRELAAWSVVRLRFEHGGEALLGLAVTPNFFDVYGLERPLLGRMLADDAPEAVIGEELWRDRFGSDPHVVGRTLRLNGLGFTVVGIAPAGFSGRIRGPGIWIPWTMQPALYPGADWFGERGPRWLTAEGRLAAGPTREQARSELQVIAARLDRLQPGRRTAMMLTNGSFGEEPALRASLFWMGPLIMAGLTLILLIACTNVAVLQLSRAVVRQREMAVRLAIGAGRWRLTRMLLTETLLLATVAGFASVAVAYEAPWAFRRLVATTSMPAYSLRPDASVLAYLGIAVLLTACFAGLSPAAESLRVNLAASMKAGDAWSAMGRASGRSHGFLVAAQVAMSLVLLVTAGLFLRGQWRAFTADPGFETQHVLLVQVDGNKGITDALRSLRAVQVVAAGSPFAEEESLGPGTVVQVPRPAGPERRSAVISFVSPEFFAALSVPISRGTVFAGPSDAVVSEALARSFWPGEDPVGKRLLLPDMTSLRVAGVARDLRSEHAGETDSPHVYRFADPRGSANTLLVRFAGPAEPVERAVMATLTRFGSDSFAPPKTLRTILDDNATRMSTIVRMVAILALTALALAVLGIYGVVALAASRRTRELGIRMALGATRRSVVGAVLSSGLRPVACGVGAGLAIAVPAVRATAVVLRHTPIPIVANDLVVYAGMGLLLAGVAVAAMLKPAVRAAAADPMQALRQD